jgi:uncharacterized protein (TIGR00369 family)
MNLLEHLAIHTEQVTKEKVILSLEVAAIHKQPFGYLHGGVSGVLIETACSLGANQHLTDGFAVGVDLQISHLNAVQSGKIQVIASPEKVGGRLQLWRAEIYLSETLIASGKCTLMVNKKNE